MKKSPLEHIIIISYDKITDICECKCVIHNITFSKKYKNLIRSKGCVECSKDSYKNSRTIGNEEFIKRSNDIHNVKYDYSLVEYVSCSTKVKILCPTHGVFEQIPSSHLQGIGCPKCGDENVSKKLRYSTENWIEKFNEIHKGKYDYSLVINVNPSEKIEIICPLHGSFYQLPASHAFGHGCPRCPIENNKIFSLSPLEDVIEKFRKVHGDKYDYSKVEYKGAHEKVIIICPDHGEFLQKPNDHYNGGCGCPKCSKLSTTSKQEKELLSFLRDLGIDVEENNRSVLYPKELDIYIKNKKIAIEFNGVFWHSFNRLETSLEKMYHYDKTISCAYNNIQLIHVNEDEWIYKKDIVKSILQNKLGLNKNRIYARKCVVNKLSNKEFSNFCEENHIQGVCNSKIKIGLYHNNELVSVMGFKKHNKHEWELSRYCSKKYTTVIGAASKIFKYFVNNYQPNEIMSFCDLRWSIGDLYTKLGFEKDYITCPNYRYVKNKKTYSRNIFQKVKLEGKLENYDEFLSESENMFNNGYRRMWDCGNIKFIWKRG